VLPSRFPEVKPYPRLRRLLRDQVDMQFRDLRTMLRLPRGTLRAGCNFGAAAILFNLIAGSSVCFFDASLEGLGSKRDRGDRFKAVLRTYYPWGKEPLDSGRVIDSLWQYTRNPLSHALGLDEAGESPEIGLQKWPLTVRKVREIEEALERPQWLPPTAYEATSQVGRMLLISVPTLYWGTHRMLHNLFADPQQAKQADALACSLLDRARASR